MNVAIHTLIRGYPRLKSPPKDGRVLGSIITPIPVHGPSYTFSQSTGRSLIKKIFKCSQFWTDAKMVARRTLFSAPNYQARKRMRMSPSPAMLVAAKRALRDTSEFKFKDTTGPFFDEDIVGINTELSSIAQGVDTDDRIGNRITMTRLDLQLLAKNSGGFRVIIYVPKIANANLPNTLLYHGVDNSKFWVLHDEFYGMPVGGTLSQVAVNLKINKILKIFYSNNTATSYEKNPIKLYCNCLIRSAGSAATIEGHTKLWYKDY